MYIGGYETSLLDYPNKVCTVIFTVGCNLRCGYCYNFKKLCVGVPPKIHPETMIDILKSRKAFSEYVCITGGEPTVHSDCCEFIKALKDNGFKVKLDTNGTKPDIIKKCIPCLDYIAIDIKTCPCKYDMLTYPDEFPLIKLLDTIRIVKESGIDYELRTVMVPFLINKKIFGEIINIIMWAGVPKLYRLTQYNPEQAYFKYYKQIKPYSFNEIMEYKKILESYGIKNVVVNA